MRALVACPGCGVAVDLDAVQPTPGKKCPVCKTPLNETALQEHTNHEAQNPSDRNDAARKALRDQLAADVAGVQAEHSAAKNELAVVSSLMSARAGASSAPPA